MEYITNRHTRADRAYALQILKDKYGINNPALTRTKIRARVELKNGNNAYNGISLKDKGSVLPGERKLDSLDKFFPTGISYQLAKVGTGSAMPRYSYPDPAVFPFAGHVDSLNALYFGGHLTMKDGNDVVQDEIDGSFFYDDSTACCSEGCGHVLDTQFMISGEGDPKIDVVLAPGMDVSVLEGDPGDANGKTVLWVEICGWEYSGNQVDCDTTPNVAGLRVR